jgi:hypothetical protein
MSAGAALADWEPWRLVFLAVAIPAPLLLLLLPYLPVVRGTASRTAPSSVTVVRVPSLLSFVRERPIVLIGVYGALGCLAFGQAAISVWTAVVAMRNFGQTPEQVGSSVGVMLLVLLPLALGLNLLIMRWMMPRYGVAAPMRLMRYALVAGSLLLVILMFTRTITQFYATFFVLNLLLLPAMMNLPGLLQSLGASAMLSRIFAINVVISTFCAAASGPFVGLVSDSMKQDPFGLLTAAAGTGAAAFAMAALVFTLVEPLYAVHARNVEAERARETDGKVKA